MRRLILIVLAAILLAPVSFSAPTARAQTWLFEDGNWNVNRSPGTNNRWQPDRKRWKPQQNWNQNRHWRRDFNRNWRSDYNRNWRPYSRHQWQGQRPHRDYQWRRNYRNDTPRHHRHWRRR